MKKDLKERASRSFFAAAGSTGGRKQAGRWFYVASVCLLITGCVAEEEAPMDVIVKKTDAEWRKVLTTEQYRVLRQAGTERAFSGMYTDFEEEGVYRCAGCSSILFTSDSKFHSGCGWPSFDQAVSDGRVIERTDSSLGVRRVEILCANCGGHLGHVFPDGPVETTGLRYCINSAALRFDAKKNRP